MQSSSDTLELHSTLRSLDIGFRWLMTFVLLGLTLYAMQSMLGIPKMGKVFEDMLGSSDKLPELTRLIMASYPGCLLLPLILLCIFLPCVWLPRRPAVALFMAGLGALSLALTAGVYTFSLQSPLLQIIQGINGVG